jgi:hypothetical protein
MVSIMMPKVRSCQESECNILGGRVVGTNNSGLPALGKFMKIGVAFGISHGDNS